MKLLLTSDGINNQSLIDALVSLTPKPLPECTAVFVPTAANKIVNDDKDWERSNIDDCRDLGFKDFEVVNIDEDTNQALKKLEAADIIVMGGGETSYLMEHIKNSGLMEACKNWSNKVWVGISAGSMVCAPEILDSDNDLYDESAGYNTEGLNLVPFYILPHYHSHNFPKLGDEFLESYFKDNNRETYVLDDESGVLVDGDRVKVISEGKWRKFN